MITDRINITIDIKYDIACGLSVSIYIYIYIQLTLAYSKGQLGFGNGVTPNILAFLFSSIISTIFLVLSNRVGPQKWIFLYAPCRHTVATCYCHYAFLLLTLLLLSALSYHLVAIVVLL